MQQLRVVCRGVRGKAVGSGGWPGLVWKSGAGAELNERDGHPLKAPSLFQMFQMQPRKRETGDRRRVLNLRDDETKAIPKTMMT